MTHLESHTVESVGMEELGVLADVEVDHLDKDHVTAGTGQNGCRATAVMDRYLDQGRATVGWYSVYVPPLDDECHHVSAGRVCVPSPTVTLIRPTLAPLHHHVEAYLLGHGEVGEHLHGLGHLHEPSRHNCRVSQGRACHSHRERHDGYLCVRVELIHLALLGLNLGAVDHLSAEGNHSEDLRCWRRSRAFLASRITEASFCCCCGLARWSENMR